jgi:tRNA 2-thiocytidine biosynthesis protein TtcA
MDRALFDFRGLRPGGVPDPAGDIAFDDEPCEGAAPGAIRIERDPDD